MSDKERQAFNDLAARAQGGASGGTPEGTTARKSRRAREARGGLVVTVAGTATLVGTFTWSTTLGMLGVVVTGAGLWMLIHGRR